MRLCVSSRLDGAALKPLVVDANILVRAVLGKRVRTILATYADRVDFVTPEVGYLSTRSHVPAILRERGLSPEEFDQIAPTEIIEALTGFVAPVPDSVFAHWEAEARERLARRDEDDWPFVALALQLGCSIWTEDRDFFGSGIATWTTDRVEIYLRSEL